MARFKDYSRDQGFLLPQDRREWVPSDDLAHFVIEACDRVDLSAFQTSTRNAGVEQCHPQMMLALLIYSYSIGIFSSRQIEQATYRDIGVRYVAANQHPDHNSIQYETIAQAHAYCMSLSASRHWTKFVR